jgi:uncharacterized membrane protein
VIVTLRPIEKPPRKNRRAPRHAARSSYRQLGPHVASLAAIALLVPVHRLWAAAFLLLALLLIVPGQLLLRALRIPRQAVSSCPAYVPCASIIVLFAAGLAVDLLGPVVGVAAPLRAVPVLIGLEIICLGLLAVSVNVQPDATVEWRSLLPSAKFLWPLAIPLLAAAGALRLDNHHSNRVAVAAVAALIILLIVIAVMAGRTDEALLKVVIYAVGLAAVWSNSLRGDPLYGFDIATEYQKAHQTIMMAAWHPTHPDDAYGAMLSITVMPAELHALSGVSGLLVFKLIYPMVYAFFPVAIFSLARRILSCQWAFVAAAFTIGQYAFPEMAGFARQQIALTLFATLVVAVLQTELRRIFHYLLVALLAVAMAMSHYSTTYVAVTVLGLVLPMQWIVSWFRDVPRISGVAVSAFLAATAGAVIWYAPVTQSDSHVLEVAQTVQAQGLDLLPNRPPGGNLIAAYLQGNTKTAIPASRYEALISHYYTVNKPYIKPYNDANSPRYTLRDSAVPKPPVRWHVAYSALNLGLLLCEQLANLLAALGGLFMMFRRNAPIITRQIGTLTVATTILLTVLRFSGTLATAYGQERAQLQGLVPLAVAMCWSLQQFAESRRWRKIPVYKIAIGGLAVVFVNTTYLVGAVLGGVTSVNLANSGAAYEYFYTTAPEMASARWLGNIVHPGQLVYSDEYGQVPLAAGTDIQQGLFADLTPRTLDQHAWIYADQSDVIDGRAFAVYKNQLATYVFPSAYLETHYNLVYTNGSSEVFHR